MADGAEAGARFKLRSVNRHASRTLHPDTSSPPGAQSGRGTRCPAEICAGLHAMRAQTASDHAREPEGNATANATETMTQRPKLSGGRDRHNANSCASRSKRTRM